MSFFDLKSNIIDQDLCARCGGCVAVCPKQVIDIESNGEPFSLMSQNDINFNCADCNICLDVCPGKYTNTAASEKRIFGRQRNDDERWTGIFLKSFLATATDTNILNNASAGGGVTSLLITALRTNLVDAVIVIGRDEDHPWMPKAIITDDESVVRLSAQASYCVTPNLQLLKDTKFKRIGIVGVPCEIQAINKIKNLAELKVIAEKIVLTIEIACASNTKIEGTKYLIQANLGLKLNDVEKINYRDGKYPGKFTVYTKDEKKHELPFYNLVDTFKSFKTHRCMACKDWWSGLADISIADGDQNIYKTSIETSGSKRCSTLITRTNVGEALLHDAIRLGILEVESVSFNPEESCGLQKKKSRSADLARKFPNRVPIDSKDSDVNLITKK